MDQLLVAIANALDYLRGLLPTWTLDTGQLAPSFQLLFSYGRLAARVVPWSDLVVILGLLLAVALVWFALYLLTRALNLLRGAG